MKSPLSSRRRRKLKLLLIRRIVGESMVPTLRPGQIVLAYASPKKVKPGSVIILEHQGLEKIKRVEKLEAGKLFVVGDNLSQSTDSRQFGWLDARQIRGRIIWPRT